MKSSYLDFAPGAASDGVLAGNSIKQLSASVYAMRSSLVKFSHSFRTEVFSAVHVDELSIRDCATSRA